MRPHSVTGSPEESSYKDPSFPRIRENTTYSDSSGAIFSLYISRAQKFDEENVENWKGGAEGILVFTGLFASTVAQLLSSSYQRLQQDPNTITQSLLAQISQQLSGSPNSTTTGKPSTNAQGSFKPTAAVVFVNSVWIVSLVLSLTCALMATLLQQWARRYLQLTQRKYPPHVRAHIREYFKRGADRFRISTLVEALPALLLISVLLFFSGLVVFAFLGNNIVAFITVAIVAFCTLWYLTLTLAPLKFHDCPYQTPLSSLFWFCAQVIQLFTFTIAHHGAKIFRKTVGIVNTSAVEKYQDLQITKKKSLSHGMLNTLEGSAKCFSLDIFRTALCRTLDLIDEDHELEEFVSGIPGLSESEALRNLDPQSPDHAGRAVLAALPGPITFHEQLPWSIILLSHRAITGDLSETTRRQRARACLKALYYIPGAIRDVLAPYAAGAYYCLEILPLLNSAESLELIEELWDTANEDIAVSIRCATAAISAFIITPPDTVLKKFLTPGVQFIGREKAGSDFLSRRLPMLENKEKNDSARLQNIVLFLTDIRAYIASIDVVLWMRPDSEGSLLEDVRTERRALRDSRDSGEYRSGVFKRHGNRTSLSFIPAVQHDLLALTLEIVARPGDSVTGAAQEQRDAFLEAFSELEDFVKTAQPDGRITETAEMVVDALRSIAEKLRSSQDSPTPQPELEPPDQSSSGAASSSTVQGVGVEPGPEPRAGDKADEVTPDRLPLASSGAVSYSALEGISTADSTSAPPTRSTTTSLTSPDKSSYPSRSLSSSSERAERDPTTLV